ncbi:14558_t:CDS:1, partial [Racocetra fulgida]
MSNAKYVTIAGCPDSPVFHIRLNENVKANSIEEKEKFLQEVVDE